MSGVHGGAVIPAKRAACSARSASRDHRLRNHTAALGYGSPVSLAEPVIGPAEGRTRWLGAGYDGVEV